MHLLDVHVCVPVCAHDEERQVHKQLSGTRTECGRDKIIIIIIVDVFRKVGRQW